MHDMVFVAYNALSQDVNVPPDVRLSSICTDVYRDVHRAEALFVGLRVITSPIVHGISPAGSQLKCQHTLVFMQAVRQHKLFFLRGRQCLPVYDRLACRAAYKARVHQRDLKAPAYGKAKTDAADRRVFFPFFR